MDIDDDEITPLPKKPDMKKPFGRPKAALAKGKGKAAAKPKPKAKAKPQPAPVGVPVPLVVAPVARHGKKMQDLAEFPIEDQFGNNIGFIKLDRLRHQFNAHCCQLGGSKPKDHRTAATPACRCNRTALKKPLGFLIQWLRQSEAFDNRGEHRESEGLITLELRRECRDWLRGRPELEPLMIFEAVWNGLVWRGPHTVEEPDDEDEDEE